jgi:hypothetical protein
LTYKVSEYPPLWFDEGWTLSVAKNWVETGQYARLLNGTAISATGMAWNFPVLAPIALSFRIFGIGVWQGRLPGILFTFAGILLVYLLANKLFNNKVAVVSVFLLLFAPEIPLPPPIIYGRQAIGEPAMIFYLMAGFYIFYTYMEKPSVATWLGTILLWGAALTAKPQSIPFLCLSILSVLGLALIRRDQHVFQAAMAVFLGSLIAWRVMMGIQAWFEYGLPLYGAPMKGLLYVTGWVPVLYIRLLALRTIGIWTIPLIAGLVIAFIKGFRRQQNNNALKSSSYLSMAYWVLTASWLAWFASMGMYWPKYLYPVVFIGSPFAADFFLELTKGLIWDDTSVSVEHKKNSRLYLTKIMQFCIATLLFLHILINGITSIRITSSQANNDAQMTATFLNNSTRQNAIIETYDSELLFLVDRNFSYPPDQVQVELNKRFFLSESVDIAYSPMESDAEYLVVGPYSKMWRLYETSINQKDKWKLIFSLPTYKVYQRLN